MLIEDTKFTLNIFLRTYYKEYESPTDGASKNHGFVKCPKDLINGSDFQSKVNHMTLHFVSKGECFELARASLH